MVMPGLKTGHDAARRRFWLAMSGFVMALALLFTSRAENPEKLTWNWRSVSSLRTPTAWFW